MPVNHPPRYREFPPPAALRSVVQCLWVHDVAVAEPEGGRRLLPDGRANIVWIPDRSLHVAGPQTRFVRPLPVGGVRVLGARLWPGAAQALLAVPTAEYVDEHVPLEAIDSRLAARLDARLGDARDTRAALAAFAAELARSLRDAAPLDPAVRAAVKLLDRRDATVAGAAARVNLSERALQRRFADQVGFGPKTLHRVLRFQRFLRAVPDTELAGAAAVAGYADQAHLTREATRLSGLTPRQLRTFQH